MKTVYISSPFRGDTEKNKQNAIGYSRSGCMGEQKAKLSTSLAVACGVMPIAPPLVVRVANCSGMQPNLLFPQFLDDDDPKQCEIGLKQVAYPSSKRSLRPGMSLQLINICDELWVFGDEITHALAVRIANCSGMQPKMESEIEYVKFCADMKTQYFDVDTYYKNGLPMLRQE